MDSSAAPIGQARRVCNQCHATLLLRKQYTPLSDEQTRWLSNWAAEQARVLHRVMRGLSLLGHDVASPVCRRTYDAEVALRSTA